MDRLSENGPMASTEILKPCIDDMKAFDSELRKIEDSFGNASSELRDQMDADGRILSVSLPQANGVLSAVDGSVTDVTTSGLSIIIGCAIRWSEDEFDREFSRVMTGNTPDIALMRTAIRLQLEMRLLKSAQKSTILDGSFWSLLMDSNRVVTAWRGNNDIYQDQYDECYERGGTFISVTRNKNIVAMSKAAISSVLSTKTRKEGGYRELFNGYEIPDRLLYSQILNPGEITKPVLLDTGTTGKTGFEHKIMDYEEIQHVYRSNIYMLYFKPWPYQRAYRIEYHRSQFPDGSDAMKNLLSQIKSDTRHPAIQEPIPQYMADRIAKHVGSARELYLNYGRREFPQIMGNYRTK